ncbi:hypothetical protein F4604DRAFT_1683247 [Suillus subluteus]|nr:hypothetical protein F4604DRAFT_1683247 [Suillus subluteus]
MCTKRHSNCAVIISKKNKPKYDQERHCISMSDVEMVDIFSVIAKKPEQSQFRPVHFRLVLGILAATCVLLMHVMIDLQDILHARCISDAPVSKQISISMLMSRHRKYYHCVDVHDAEIPLNARSTDPLWLDIAMTPYMAKPEEFVTVHEGSLEFEEAANAMAEEDSVKFELRIPGNRVATYFTVQSLVLGEQKHWLTSQCQLQGIITVWTSSLVKNSFRP